MTTVQAGRAIAALGVVFGVIAIFTTTLSNGSSVKYSDDGTIIVYLLIVLGLAALLLAAGYTGRSGLDLAAAAVGGAAFGFFLLIPAAYAFEFLDHLDVGGWLGLLTVLIPVGGWIAHAAEHPAAATPVAPQLAVPAAAGLGLCLVSIWLKSEEAFDNVSYWNLSLSGDHWLGILMLALLVVGAALLLAAVTGTLAGAAGWLLVVSAVIFGLFVALLVGDAFNLFGRLGAGGWLGALGGALTLAGTVVVWRAATAGATAQTTEAPAAQPM